MSRIGFVRLGYIRTSQDDHEHLGDCVNVCFISRIGNPKTKSFLIWSLNMSYFSLLCNYIIIFVIKILPSNSESVNPLPQMFLSHGLTCCGMFLRKLILGLLRQQLATMISSRAMTVIVLSFLTVE